MKPVVAVIGGGFAGLSALSVLVRSGACDIVLYEKNTFTTMVPVIPDLASGILPQSWVATPLPRRIVRSIRVTYQPVTGIGLKEKVIQTESGHTAYDYAIVCAGSVPAPPPPGVAAFTLGSVQHALELRREFLRFLRTSQPATPVVVIGAGYNGIELAARLRMASLHMKLPHPTIVIDKLPKLLPFLSPSQRMRLVKYLDDCGVELMLSTSVTDLGSDHVRIGDALQFVDPFLCWTTGVRASAQQFDSEIEVLPDKRCMVNEYLQIPGFPRVFCAGDNAAMRHKGKYLRQAIQFAVLSGGRAAYNCLRLMGGGTMKSFSPADPGWIIPLPGFGIGTLLGIPLHGRVALALHLMIDGYRSTSWQNRLRFAYGAMRTMAAGLPTNWAGLPDIVSGP